MKLGVARGETDTRCWPVAWAVSIEHSNPWNEIHYNKKNGGKLHLKFIVHLIRLADLSYLRLEDIIKGLHGLVKDSHRRHQTYSKIVSIAHCKATKLMTGQSVELLHCF